jgi:alpha-1,2-mannosyltransferase
MSWSWFSRMAACEWVRLSSAWTTPVRRALEGLRPTLALVVVAGAVAGVLAAAGVPARTGLYGGFKDLSVYRYGGRLVLDGAPLYASRDPGTGLRFTYPPFAALGMAPLALLPGWLVTALWTAASVGALAAVVLVARGALGRTASGWPLALLTAGALALEPVWQNLTFGQVNLVLMLAVLIDLVQPERRWSGILVGVAAGVKLTPLVFVVLLVLAGRRAAAGRALLAFAGTVAIGFAVAPGSARAYWTGNLVDAGRVGPPELAHNQSVFGALTRLLDGPPPTPLWLAVAGPLALAVVAVGAVWWLRGDRVLGTGLAASAMLLASPVSWSHHWVWAVPVALALWERSRWAGVVWTAVFVARPFVWPPWGESREYGWSPVEHVLGNAYVLVALALAVWAAARTRRRADSPAARPGPQPLPLDATHPVVGRTSCDHR